MPWPRSSDRQAERGVPTFKIAETEAQGEEAGREAKEETRRRGEAACVYHTKAWLALSRNKWIETIPFNVEGHS